jgi:hypothetical protein
MTERPRVLSKYDNPVAETITYTVESITLYTDNDGVNKARIYFGPAGRYSRDWDLEPLEQLPRPGDPWTVLKRRYPPVTGA